MVLCSTRLSSPDQPEEGRIYLSLHQEPGWEGGDRAEGCPWGQTHLFPLTHAQGSPDPQQTWLWRTGKLHSKGQRFLGDTQDSSSDRIRPQKVHGHHQPLWPSPGECGLMSPVASTPIPHHPQD